MFVKSPALEINNPSHMFYRRFIQKAFRLEGMFSVNSFPVYYQQRNVLNNSKCCLVHFFAGGCFHTPGQLVRCTQVTIIGYDVKHKDALCQVDICISQQRTISDRLSYMKPFKKISISSITLLGKAEIH